MLASYKEKYNLSNYELARRMNIHPCSVYRVLHYGQAGPKVIKAIAKLTGEKEIDVYAYYKQFRVTRMSSRSN